VETFPLLDPLDWHIIGYEEYRLGHNRLIEQGLFSLVPDYHHGFNEIGLPIRWMPERVINGKELPSTVWPPNSWHMAGCNEAFEYWFYLPEDQKLQPLADYISSPVIEGWRPDLRGYTTVKTDLCDWCGKEFRQGHHVCDYIQEHVFCCPEHARLHRRKTFDVWPQLQAVYQYKFHPLPADPRRMLAYFTSLPDVHSDLVILRPINLPTVEHGHIERVSSGNEEKPPKGFTTEGHQDW
jgi:hypothetical protein